MTKEKFAYYYKTEQNLAAIEDSLPKVAKSIERERAVADSVERNLNKQIDLANKKETILKKSRNEWANTATNLEINNTTLRGKLDKEKKKKWYYIGGGAAATGLLRLGFKLAFGI